MKTMRVGPGQYQAGPNGEIKVWRAKSGRWHCTIDGESTAGDGHPTKAAAMKAGDSLIHEQSARERRSR